MVWLIQLESTTSCHRHVWSCGRPIAVRPQSALALPIVTLVGKRSAEMQRQQHDVYDALDMAVFVASTCIAICGAWALVQKEEWFLSISSFGLALGFCVVSLTVARSPPSSGARPTPWFSVFHIIFWMFQFFYALFSGTAQHAVNAHARLIPPMRHAMVWVVMGAVGGFYPGSAFAKLVLFLGSAFFITGRNLVLAYRWEQSQVDDRQKSVMRLLLDAQTVALVDGTPTRLSTELLLLGWASFVGAALLGLSIGMLFRAGSRRRSAAAIAAASASAAVAAHAQSEVAMLRKHTMALEAARRDALVAAERLRHRRQQRRHTDGGSLASAKLDVCFEAQESSAASQADSDHSD